MPVVNYLKKVQLPNNTEYTVKDPTFFTGTTEEWNLLSIEEKQSYKIVNLTDDEEEGDISGKADKVTGAVDGNFAGLDGNGNLTDSGHKHSDYLTQHQDISGKADKVTSATNGNLAGLNSSGNLTDSTWSADKTTQSATGNPISIPDLKVNQLAVNPIITFEPIETGTGTKSPSNPWTISGYDKVDVESCGKNLFDGTYSATSKYLNSSGEEVGGGFNISQYISVKASTAYYFTNLSNPTSACICWYNSAKEFISSTNITLGFTATSPSNACYVRASIHTDSTDVCINEGNSAITYIPYNKATSISESLGQTVYGATWYPRTGELVVDRKIVDMGNLSWNAFGSSYPSIFYAEITDGILMTTPTGSDNGTCEIYAVVAKYILTLGDKECTLGSTNVYNNKGSIMLKDTTYTDAATLKTAVTGHQLVYELATPFTIQLTPHEISLLKDYAYVSTNGTSIALDYHNGELASLADVSQLGETVNELGDYVGANIKANEENLLTHTSSNPYEFPCDGYVIVYSGSATSGKIDLNLRSADNQAFGGINMEVVRTSQMQSTFVKKGMKAYLTQNTTASGSSVVVVFRGLKA